MALQNSMHMCIGNLGCSATRRSSSGRNVVAINERAGVISHDAGEFARIVMGRRLARDRIIDWFHIAMKFQATPRSVFGSMMIDSMDQKSVETEIPTSGGWSGAATGARRWSGSRDRQSTGGERGI
jgi:hypothetical protein